MFQTVDIYASYVFFVACAALVFLSHFFYEVGLWRRKEFVLPTVLPLILIASAVFFSLRIELLLILLPVFAIFRLAAILFNTRLADLVNDIIFPLVPNKTAVRPLFLDCLMNRTEKFAHPSAEHDERIDFEREFEADFPEEDFEENAFQQWTRTFQPEVADILSGWVRFDFVPDQRLGSIHLPFSPAFSGIPDIEIHQIEGPEVKINIAQLMPYGARLDLKRSDQTAEASVRIHISVVQSR